MSNETSKFLSYVLRHAPESIGISLDQNGWTSVDDLISKANASGRRLDLKSLLAVVETSDKKRFTLSDDETLIRAAQGHSVKVELGLAASIPPAVLFHGTAARNIETIRKEGLKPGNRLQVHLSLDVETARKVGQRHGTPVVLSVDSGKMHADGHIFNQADNGVWLTDFVPPSYFAE
jgi:putative RNA 2'-phosphotransferase